MTDTNDRSPLLERPRFVDRLEDCFFYHAMDLPEFGLVPAHWDLRGRFDDYVGGVGVAGKSVLDIGTATGFLSFEAEKLGDLPSVQGQTLLSRPRALGQAVWRGNRTMEKCLLALSSAVGFAGRGLLRQRL
jgi:hypothetical protein